MEKRGFSQEGLKLIACVTMLIDHIGAEFFPSHMYLRMIGRIAFPIYCFLLAEGAHYTKNPVKYGLRLAIGLLLSELPFDYGLFSGFTWQHQSVMVTLLIGFVAIELINRLDNDVWKLLVTVGAYGLAQFAKTDYGGCGVLLIILLSQTRGRLWLQTVVLFLMTLLMNSVKVSLGSYRIPIETLAVVAMIPIGLYSGKKRTDSKAVQWAFYLFYPVHLSCIWIAKILLSR